MSNVTASVPRWGPIIILKWSSSSLCSVKADISGNLRCWKSLSRYPLVVKFATHRLIRTSFLLASSSDQVIQVVHGEQGSPRTMYCAPRNSEADFALLSREQVG